MEDTFLSDDRPIRNSLGRKGLWAFFFLTALTELASDHMEEKPGVVVYLSPKICLPHL